MKWLIRGKTKSIYEDYDPDKVVIKFDDVVTANNGEKSAIYIGKGQYACNISWLLFQELEKNNIATHIDSRLADNAMVCKKVDIIPIEVVVRNKAAGGLCRGTTIEEGTVMSPALVEFFLKDDSKNDPLLTGGRILKMGYDINLPNELATVAHDVNYVLKRVFDEIGYDLVDFKLELGYSTTTGELLVADEISPDSCRLWKKGTNESFDKDIYREATNELAAQREHLLDAYQQICVDLLDRKLKIEQEDAVQRTP